VTRVLVLQGPNLQLLGTREPGIYGRVTLPEIQVRLDRLAGSLGATLTHVQSDHEGVLVEAIHHGAATGCVGAVVNAAAYTHTSVALRDALLATRLPFVEIHLSNLHAREPFRQTSLLADIAVGVVTGFGPEGYDLALRGLLARTGGTPPTSGV
jgi:3-dehydroquinate dehydratase-2